MTLSRTETMRLIRFLLDLDKSRARKQLFTELNRQHIFEPEFVSGVIEHGQSMSFSSDEWFDLLVKIPNRNLYVENWLTNKLTPRQRMALGLN